MSRKAGTAGADRLREVEEDMRAAWEDLVAAALEAPAAGAGQEPAAGPAAPDAAAAAAAPADTPAAAVPADTPAPPGPGRWRWNAAAGRHEKITGEN